MKARNVSSAGLVLAIALALTIGVAQAQGGPTGKIRADFGPALGLRLQSLDGSVDLVVPSGALSESAVFSHEALPLPSESQGAVRIGKAFRLEAEAHNGNRKIKNFAKKLRLAASYGDAELAAARGPAESLRLYYQDDAGTWVPIATTVDRVGKKLRAEIDHFTDFAMGGSGANDNFIRSNAPTLGTSYSGHEWLTDGTAWGVCSNTACSHGPAQSDNYARIDSTLAEQRVKVNVWSRPTTASGMAGIVANTTADWNTYMIWVGLDAAGRVEVWTLIAGSWSASALATANTTYTSTADRTLEARTANTTVAGITVATRVTVYVDDVEVLGPVTVPPAPAGATYAGFYAGTYDDRDTNWPRFDAFIAGPPP